MTEKPTQTSRTVVILGAGFTGKALIPILAGAGYTPIATHRISASGDTSFGGLQTVRFDLGAKETWNNIPETWGCVWTFPAEPRDAVSAFADILLPRTRRLVVIGTTSSYRQRDDDENISEGSPLDSNSPRVAGEELLRAHGAIVLRSAGIYGPGRNPLDWLRRGMIGGGEKFLNLIHVLDLASTILAALESSQQGEEFIVTDGTPRRWKEIATWAEGKGFLEGVSYGGSGRKSSRRLSNEKLLARLKPRLDHADLFVELETLEKESRTRQSSRDAANSSG